MFDPARTLRRLASLVIDRPALVVASFLAATAILAGGVGMVEQRAGADQFSEEVPAMDAMESIEDEFEGGIGDEERVAQLFVQDENVLSRPALIRTLETQERLESHGTLRVDDTSSHADAIARELDPEAETPAERKRAVERATDRELGRAIAAAAERDALDGQLSVDYNPTAQRASTALVTVRYDVPDEYATDDLAALQYRSKDVIATVPGNRIDENVRLFGEGILQEEIVALLGDTATVVFPAAVFLILLFLLVAYRDPIDMALGLSALVLTLVWTFGFMGYAGIPFSDAVISVFPLLLAVGIDFGIHSINRYREERQRDEPIGDAMRITTDQLWVAFLIVTMTTVIGFVANFASALSSLRDFGIVATIGMLFTFLIFGVYLPSAKILLDRLRVRFSVPTFGTAPIVSGASRFGRSLSVGVVIARAAPAAFLIAVVVLAAVAGAYGTGVDTEFSEEAFFPDQERIDAYERLPEPFSPSTYTFIDTLDILEEDFDRSFVDTVTIYVDEPVRRNAALETIDRATRRPPDSFKRSESGRADADSIVTVVRQRAAEDEEFARLVARNDRHGNGIPDRNVDRVYGELLDSPRRDEARRYVAEDRGSARIDFAVKPDAETPDTVADARRVADRMPADAVATGQLVVQQSVIDATLESAIRSLFVALALTIAFLMISYRLLEGRAAYGLINLVPVLVTVGFLMGSMRYLNIPLTPINAPILAVSIGLGVDYTVHFVHRFVDEYERDLDTFDALDSTIAGTGGALTGSMITTVAGIGVLYAALIPLIQQFGVLIALGVFYAYLSSVLVVPSTIVVWQRIATRIPS